VHILIALAWVPIPEEYKDLKISTYINRSLIVDHIDGDKENNNADNLRWCTSYENSNFGNFEKNSKALIGNQNAKGGKQHGRSERYIYTYEGNDYTMKELAEFLECSKSRITEAFRRNLGLVKQGRLTRRLIK
jgi:AraC-like DNA-binding protein